MTFRTTALLGGETQRGKQHAGESGMQRKGGTWQFRKSCAYGEIGQLSNPSSRVIPSISVLPSMRRRCWKTLVICACVKKTTEQIGSGTPSSSIQQEMILIGNKRAPNRTTRSMYAKAGSPTSGNAHGDGILIVIPKEQSSSRRNEGAALEGGPERAIDTGTQEREQEFSNRRRYAKVQNADAYVEILRERGKRGLPVERVYRQLFNQELYLKAYGRIYRNKGAMTRGITDETADGMSLEKIDTIIDALRHERCNWKPARRVWIVRFVPLKRLTKPRKGVRSEIDLNNFMSKQVRKLEFLLLPLK